MRQKQLVIDDTGSVEGILAQSGDQDRYHGCLTDGLTLKDSATQLLIIKYKCGALVTQY